jgi:hypothetical protein
MSETPTPPKRQKISERDKLNFVRLARVAPKAHIKRKILNSSQILCIISFPYLKRMLIRNNVVMLNVRLEIKNQFIEDIG